MALEPIMASPLNPEYADIVDDIYLAYVRVLSAVDNADFAEFIDFVAEYTTTPAEAALVGHEAQTRTLCRGTPIGNGSPNAVFLL